MTQTTTTWAVYVSDDAGWQDNCPSYQDVFYGEIPAGGVYVGPDESELGGVGHVEFATREAAERFEAELNESGDWTPHTSDDADECRPEYGVCEVIDGGSGV